MHTELQNLLYAADDHYLSDADLEQFQKQLTLLKNALRPMSISAIARYPFSNPQQTTYLRNSPTPTQKS
ncbi:MAG: hypothetical protein HC852_00160 [Acaryochloridaceae cyanobacterium RU_4_10]|nr:hypothetical protein [Acaryochloridaceae cyanobacterium RU_4_10]